MENNKLNTYLGFAIKSNAIIYGYENIKKSRRIIYLMLITENNSNTTKKAINWANENQVEYLIVNKEQMSFNTNIIAIINENLAGAIKSCLSISGGNKFEQ